MPDRDFCAQRQSARMSDDEHLSSESNLTMYNRNCDPAVYEEQIDRNVAVSVY